jgi:hypothetical protein
MNRASVLIFTVGMSVGLGFFSEAALSHPMDPAWLKIEQATATKVHYEWESIHIGANVESTPAPVFPPGCQVDGQPQIEKTSRGFSTIGLLHCLSPKEEPIKIEIRHLENIPAGVFVVWTRQDQSKIKGYLHEDGNRTFILSESAPNKSLSQLYKLGMRHVWEGIDHLLFLLGLLMLGLSRKRLVLLVTGFTGGHMVSLFLVGYVGVTPPSHLVEICIAITLILMAYAVIETSCREGGDKVAQMSIASTFVYGLIHGCGFAGAVSNHMVSFTSLFLDVGAFNLGVETAQLCVVFGLFLLLHLMRFLTSRSRLRIRYATAYMIGSMGAYYVIERVIG